VPILLNLERIINGGTFDNLAFTTIRSHVIFGGMSETYIINKVVCFGADGVIIFQGLKIGVIIHLISKHYPFVARIHYMAHQCNLVV
jgi:hypothetical protein